MIVGRALDEGVSGGEPASEVGTPGEVGAISNGTALSASNSGAGNASSACSEGSAPDAGPTARSETRFPQRVLASLVPSVIRVSPLCSVSRFFVQ
jgi:hypothetical protein